MNRTYLITGAIIAAIIILATAGALYTIPHGPVLPVVYIVYGSEKGDLSYTDSAYRGLFAAQETMPFTKREFTSLDHDELAPLLNGSAPGTPGLVITVGYQYTGDTERLAAENPGVRFLAIDQAGTGSSNLKSYGITSYGESYLAGVLAASATKTGRVGIILGTQSEVLEGFHQGYIDGVRAFDPSIVIGSEYVRDNSTAGFSDPVRGGEIAGRMYREGTDVIYTVAGFSGTGAIREAKRGPGRYIIGVDSDQSYLGPKVVLASAVKRVDRVVYTGIAEFLNGSFSGGSQGAGLKEGITCLVFNPEFAFYNTTVSAWEGKAEEAETRYGAANNSGHK
jgi:basic membrane protein A